MGTISISILISFIVSAVLCPLMIPLLRRLHAGQSIREIGPKWHMGKSGTPTMGGIAFIIAITVVTLIFAHDLAAVLVVLASLSFGAIGFLDDFIKVVKKRNLGLSAKAKFALQVIAAVLFVTLFRVLGVVDNTIYFPFLSGGLNLGFFYIPVMVFVVLASVNSVNITDGIDGLASGITVVVALFSTLAAMQLGQGSMAVTAGACVGAVLGFLIYNFYPAKVFMGDTGSLYLGGLLVMVSIVTKTPVFFIIAGMMYFIETLSVMIQVTVYKATGKRVFKMSPIHHHFEMSGFSEIKIFMLFCGITLVLSALSFLLLPRLF